MVGWVVLVTVAVQLPAVLLVRVNALVPPDRAVFAGIPGFGSVVVRPTVSLVLIRFQFASTALTVTLKPLPALCAVGVAAVLPVLLPAAAISPGIKSCSLVNAPALTV